jgi:hypothetical protein
MSFNMQDMMDQFEQKVTAWNRQGLTVSEMSYRYYSDEDFVARCGYKQKKRIAQYVAERRQRRIDHLRSMMNQWHLIPNGPDPWGVADRTDQELHDEIWELATRSYNPPQTVHDLRRRDIAWMRDCVFDVTEEQICRTLGIQMPRR